MTEKTEWQRGYDEGRRMGSKHRQDELDQLKAENAGLQTGFKAYEVTVQELKGEIEALKSREAASLDAIIRAVEPHRFDGVSCGGPGLCLMCSPDQYGKVRLP